jgi:hypothetical protein
MLALALALALAAADPPAAAERYDAAMALLLDGRLAEAAAAFEEVARDPAAGALAERARALAEASRALAARGRFVLAPPPGAAPAPRPRPDRSGRAELALFSTAWGITTGVGIGIVAELEDVRGYVALTLGGGAAGLATSILATRGRAMPSGRAQAIESAAVWGGFNGGMIARLAGVDEGRHLLAATLGSGAAALAGAVGLTALATPSSGDVALTNSGGLWGLGAGALTLGLVGEPSEDETLGVLVGFADAGLLTGALLARRFETSRSRMLLVDAGGLVGTIAGVGIPILLESENARVVTGSGLAGMALGLGLAAWFTRDWDRADERPRAVSGLSPFVARRVGGFSAGMAGTF